VQQQVQPKVTSCKITCHTPALQQHVHGKSASLQCTTKKAAAAAASDASHLFKQQLCNVSANNTSTTR
jgi:hypothetical protein